MPGRMFALIMSMTFMATSAVAASPSARDCRKACSADIAACIAKSGNIGGCVRSVVRHCKKTGTQLCSLKGTWDFVGTWQQGPCHEDVPPFLNECALAEGSFAWSILFYENQGDTTHPLVADVLQPETLQRSVVRGAFDSPSSFTTSGMILSGTATHIGSALTGTVDGNTINAVWDTGVLQLLFECCTRYRGTMTRPTARPCYVLIGEEKICPPDS